MDFYRKLPTDLTEATLSGAAISIVTTLLILFLLGAVRGAGGGLWQGVLGRPLQFAACGGCAPREAIAKVASTGCSRGSCRVRARSHTPLCRCRHSCRCLLALFRVPYTLLPCNLHAVPQELSSYMSTQTKTELVVDRSAHGELLRVNFNLSFPQVGARWCAGVG